jgi:hypothetical protein
MSSKPVLETLETRFWANFWMAVRPEPEKHDSQDRHHEPKQASGFSLAKIAVRISLDSASPHSARSALANPLLWPSGQPLLMLW